MPRSDWSSFGARPGEMVPVDISATPMGRVGSEATVIGAVAQQFSNATAELLVYRDDPKDAPNRVNADVYEAWLDLPSHRSFGQMLRAASTEDNENLRQFLGENVVIVKREPDDRHRAADIPLTVKMMLGRTSQSSTGAA